MVTKTFKGTVLAALSALLASSCTPEAVEDALPVEAAPTNDAATDPLSCDTDFGEILSLLQSGLPDYDYEPAADLKALVTQSDVVLTGTLDSIVRSVDMAGVGGGDPTSRWTTISTSDSQILHQGPVLQGEVLIVPEISMFSSWWQEGGPDPMANRVKVRGMSLVAFLVQDVRTPDRLVVDVQGLIVGCTGSEERARVVVEPLPKDVSGLSVAELVEAIVLLEE